jgi:hypothetical protein
MSRASRRAEPWPTIYHGSDYTGRRRGYTFSDEGYVGQVGAFNGLITQVNGDHRALRCTSLAFREPRPTKKGSPLALKLITDYCPTDYFSPVPSRLSQFVKGEPEGGALLACFHSLVFVNTQAP